MIDEERIRALCATDVADVAAAATAAIQALSPQILRYLVSMLRDEEEAKDAHALWAENLWKGLPTFRWESSLRVWAYRLAQNAALKMRDEAWRRRGRRLRTTEASALADEVRRSSMMLREARAEKVARLRESLEPEEQALLVLRLDQELSWTEISAVLSAEEEAPLSEAALRQRFHRIKEKLEKQARKEGLL